MKKKFSKILGVGLTLALLISLLVTAAPALATVTVPSLSASSNIISADGTYTLTFQITDALAAGTDTITVEFPAGFDVSGITAAEFRIAATSGIGTTAFALAAADAVAISSQKVTGTVTTGSPIGVGATVQVVVGDATPTQVTNAGALGDYELKVNTSQETTQVASASFTLTAPVISPLPGIVTGKNADGVVLYQATGDPAIDNAIGTAGVATIEVGPGTYTGAITADVADQVIVSTDGAATTIINTTTTITAEVTIDGFTFEGVLTANSATEPTVQNSVIEAGAVVTQAVTFDSVTFEVAAAAIGVDVNGAGATITGSTFNVIDTGTGVDVGAGVTIENSMFNGASGIGIDATGAATATIEGNVFDGLDTAITASASTPTLVIESNVISNSTDEAIIIDAAAASVIIIDNTISDNMDDILLATINAIDTNIFMNFNTLMGNTGSVDNDDNTTEIDATNNYWGVATGPAVASTGNVEDDPWLPMAASDPIISVGATTLVARTTAGVDVTNTGASTAIAVAKYADNPGTAAVPGVASAYYDVYVSGGASPVTVMLYGNVSADTVAYVWGAGLGEWVAASNQAVNVFAGSITVTITAATIPTIADLAGLPFAIANPTAVGATLAGPTMIAPTGGDDDVSLTPTFAWTAVAGAAGYEFEFADNADFIAPLLADRTGEDGHLIVTAYAHRGDLPYDTAYYWRVRAISGDWIPKMKGAFEVGGNFTVESPWTSSVFITMVEPAEVTPPVEIVIPEAPELPDIVIEQPDIVVPLPAETPITPSWIYVVIGVGAVLVIALIVLIVRTRRVA